MSRARILADYVAGGTTAAEFDYLDGVTSNIQTQFTAKAPLASPAFTGTPTGITAAHLEAGVLPVGVTGGSGLTHLASNPTVTLGSNATFPTGMMIKSGLLALARDPGAINISGTSYTDVGISGTITTLASSANSRLVFKMYRGMMYVDDDYSGNQSTMTLRASSSETDYDRNDDLISSTNAYYNYINGGKHNPRYEEIHYKAGTSTPINLTSYGAGDTLYWRYFAKCGNASYPYTFIHSDSHYSVEYQEIAL